MGILKKFTENDKLKNYYMEFKVGDEVEIIGSSRYNKNGFNIGSIGYIIHHVYSTSIYYVSNKSRTDWYGYDKENIKKSKRQIRNDNIKKLIKDEGNL